MKHQTFFLHAVMLSLVLPAAYTAPAQQHRATHLGNPATRFAPPISTPEQLRARFSDPKLRPDIASILRQCGWDGNLNDLYHAAATGEVTQVEIPTGTLMPFMSSREAGRPVALRDVLWAGKAPVEAYAFEFTSKGRFYQCVTPKPCSNFYLEDLGAPVLAIACATPAQVPTSRPAELCLTIRNTGDAYEPATTVSLALPQDVVLIRATDNGILSQGNLTWRISDLDPGDSKEIRAVLNTGRPGPMTLAATAAGTLASAVRTTCETRVVGIPAILIDAVDLEDPVEIGTNVTYDIKITNQGAIPCTNLRLACTLPENEQFVSGSGPTPVHADGASVTTEPLPSFPSKQVVTWRVVVKALKPGDVRFKVNVYADEFAQPIYEEESTLLYQ